MPESVKEELVFSHGWDPRGTTAIVLKCVRPSPASEASDLCQFCNFCNFPPHLDLSLDFILQKGYHNSSWLKLFFFLVYKY